MSRLYKTGITDLVWQISLGRAGGLSLRGAVSDEAISVVGQRLLRCTRNDTLTFCHAWGFCPIVLLHC